MANKPGVIAGLALAGAGLYLMLQKAGLAAPSMPDINAVAHNEDELNKLMGQWERYFNHLIEKYSDDPTLADQLNQALANIYNTLAAGMALSEDSGFLIFIEQLTGYIDYREEVGYITFHEYVYGW